MGKQHWIMLGLVFVAGYYMGTNGTLSSLPLFSSI